MSKTDDFVEEWLSPRDLPLRDMAAGDLDALVASKVAEATRPLVEALEIIAKGAIEDGWILVAPQFVQNALAKARKP